MNVQDEIFDVVNERDEVIGQATRGEVHRRGLMHRAIHVFVFNSRGELFLQKRSMLKDRQPGLWDSSASGHVDSGEEYDACAIRELKEELGLVMQNPPRPLFKLTACAQTDQEHVWVYETAGEGPFTLHPEEIETGKWAEPKVVDDWVQKAPEQFAPAFQFLWNKFRQKAGRS